MVVVCQLHVLEPSNPFRLSTPSTLHPFLRLLPLCPPLARYFIKLPIFHLDFWNHPPHSSSSSLSLRSCTTMAPPLVYELPLTDTGAPDIAGEHIGLPPPREPYTLRIAIEGASPITRNGSLWTNVPAKGEKFGRNKFREFKFVSHLIFF